ncbi:hypothetical protein ACIBG8_38005 [Nonomuraea sp. NPDC050556]|uniref:hypothetical protein n=1 Tax=Nonomuraea sp. NPDC050556 TaxID=3364369 RepID=UPI0037A8C469
MDKISDMPRSNRRGFIGWMSKIGIGAVGTVAGMTATARASHAVEPNWNCCKLALPDLWCPKNASAQYYCPPGYTMKVWTCCSGTAPWQRKYACGECTQGATCGDGPVYCSAGWVVSANRC